MLQAFTATERGLEPTPEPASAAWVLVSDPEDADLARLREIGIPSSLLDHVRDPDERPRTEHVAGVVLIVLHFPFQQGPAAPIPFISLPLSIFLTASRVVTVTPRGGGLFKSLIEGDVEELVNATHARFVLRLMWQLANEFLKSLRAINDAVEGLENALRQALRNEEVLGLLRFEKSLVYFSNALSSNELVLQRLQKGGLLDWRPDDEDMLEDVIIEVRQAREMVDIAQDILSQMMDAFASIVSNNLNAVMKFLTSVTIIISLPTLIASLYGMNVILPGARDPRAFAWIMAVAVTVSGGLVAVFARKRWF